MLRQKFFRLIAPFAQPVMSIFGDCALGLLEPAHRRADCACVLLLLRSPQRRFQLGELRLYRLGCPQECGLAERRTTPGEVWRARCDSATLRTTSVLGADGALNLRALQQRAIEDFHVLAVGESNGPVALQL